MASRPGRERRNRRGNLRPGLAGTHEIEEVRQHDLADEALHRLTGRHFGPPIMLGAGPVLATGDVFVSDSAVRDRLAAGGAQLVDMEGYAVARAALMCGVGVRLVKHVSDEADEAAAGTWADTVVTCSQALGRWCSTSLADAAHAVPD